MREKLVPGGRAEKAREAGKLRRAMVPALI
jgi:hypothetical protein